MNGILSVAHPYFSAGSPPRVLAHRGFVTKEMISSGLVENTRAAFAAAHAAGATYVESDCHLTSDGHVVLFHDADLRRVADDPRSVADVSLEELRGLMEDKGGLLTLAEACTEFSHLHWNIDVKADDAAELAGLAVAPCAERVLLTSFDDARRTRALVAAQRAGGTPATSAGAHLTKQILLATALRRRKRACALLRQVDALQIMAKIGPIPVVTRRLIAYAHAAGVEIHVWTINSAAEMRRLLQLGVDGIVTDRTDLAFAQLAAERNSR